MVCIFLAKISLVAEGERLFGNGQPWMGMLGYYGSFGLKYKALAVFILIDLPCVPYGSGLCSDDGIAYLSPNVPLFLIV
jgi:hypothetical protein